MRRLLSYLTSFAFSVSYVGTASFSIVSYAGPGSECQKAVEDAISLCKSAGDMVRSGSDAGAASLAQKFSTQYNTPVSAFDMQGLANQSAQAYSNASNYCRGTAEKACKSYCSQKRSEALASNPPKTQDVSQIDSSVKNCSDTIGSMIGQLDAGATQAGQAGAQAGQTGDTSKQETPSSGGMSPMMAGLLGAALGGAAGYMLGKKQGEKDKDKDKTEDVVSEDGTVDCTKSGAEAYSDCNSYFATKCALGATDASTDQCKTFNNRYCSSSTTTTTTTTTDTSTDTDSGTIASASDKDIGGEGMGSQYCFSVQATSFCATSGRETCPSCLQLEANKADACQSNPALCLAQNSPAEIEAAKNSCPSDPLFSNPDYVAGGGATVENSGSLEDPILPTQTSSSASSDVAGSDGSSSSSSSSSSGLPSDVAGGGNDGSSSSSSVIGSSPSDVASGSGSGSGLTFASAKSDVARGGGSANNRVLASASPVGASMGPSLFTMSSAMIQSRCETAQLVHCSK